MSHSRNTEIFSEKGTFVNKNRQRLLFFVSRRNKFCRFLPRLVNKHKREKVFSYCGHFFNKSTCNVAENMV